MVAQEANGSISGSSSLHFDLSMGTEARIEPAASISVSVCVKSVKRCLGVRN